jgi:serine/threonine protein kinase
MSAEIDDIKDIGEEEYIIMNLDSRQMETDGTNWFVKNMKGERGFDEPIPYVTSIELVESYIPNTFYNVEQYNNVLTFGTLLERYVLNDPGNDITNPPTVYAINATKNKIYEMLHETDVTVPALVREYAKLKPDNSTSTFVIRYNIIFDTSDTFYTIRFSLNSENQTVNDIEKCLIRVTDADGNEIKRSVIDNATVCDVKVGRLKLENGTFVYPTGTFDMYTATDPIDLDDIPENTNVYVYSYARVEFPIQNYTADNLMETTNGYIKSHLKKILDPRRDDIVSFMPYDTFLDLHLKLEKNDSAKRFTFTSLHDHPFFIDLTDPRSITQELGFSHTFYTSTSHEMKYRQNIASSDDISSITVKELRSIPSSTDPNVTLYQAYTRLFFDGLSSVSSDVIRKNQNKIDVVFVNDYPFKTIDRQQYQTVAGTLISVYALLLKTNEYFIIPFKPSFYNIFVRNTSSESIEQLQTTENIFYKSEYGELYNDKTFVDYFEYTIDTQVIESENVINLSGERYVDLVCVEIQNELKRYNAGYNKLYRYYFDDISDLYVTSTKGNVTDLVLRNPRDFGPVSRLNKITIQFIRSDGNPYDFKTIPFFVTIAIKYLKPVLHTEAVES